MRPALSMLGWYIGVRYRIWGGSNGYLKWRQMMMPSARSFNMKCLHFITECENSRLQCIDATRTTYLSGTLISNKKTPPSNGVPDPPIISTKGRCEFQQEGVLYLLAQMIRQCAVHVHISLTRPEIVHLSLCLPARYPWWRFGGQQLELALQTRNLLHPCLVSP